MPAEGDACVTESSSEGEQSMPRSTRLSHRVAIMVCVVCMSCVTSPDITAEKQNEIRIALLRGERELQSGWSEAGVRGEALGEPSIDTIAEGQVEKFTLDVAASEELSILGVCDNNCGDLDIDVMDPNGSLVSQDHETDAYPFVSIGMGSGKGPAVAGTYTIVVSAHACSAETCHFGLQHYAISQLPNPSHFQEQVTSRLAEVRGQLIEVASDRNVTVNPKGEPTVSAINRDQYDEREIRVVKPGGTVVAFACDDDCEEMSVDILDRSGRRIDDGPNSGKQGAVFLASEWTGIAVVRSEVTCRVESCLAGWQVIEFDDQAADPASADGNPSEASLGGTGTCFAVHPRGYVLTAYHVIDGASEVTVTLADGRHYKVEAVSASPSNDIAILRLAGDTPSYLDIRGIREEDMGQHVFTIGYPVPDWLGQQPKFTDGTLSGLSGLNGERATVQISVPMQPGNSGGPIVNNQGQAIGVAVGSANGKEFARSTGSMPQNMNFAARAEYALPLFPKAPPQATATGLEDAISQARRSVCFVEAH